MLVKELQHIKDVILSIRFNSASKGQQVCLPEFQQKNGLNILPQ